MIYGSGLGFATVGADNGHNGATGEAFLNNSEVLEDFVYRSYVECCHRLVNLINSEILVFTQTFKSGRKLPKNFTVLPIPSPTTSVVPPVAVKVSNLSKISPKTSTVL